MSKCTGLEIGSRGDEPPTKQCRTDEENEALPLALHDPAAWDILTGFLTASMSMSEMDDTLATNSYTCEVGEEERSKINNSFILDMANIGDDEDEDEEEQEEGYGDGTSVQSPKVTRLAGPSMKQKLAATFNDMATWFEHNPCCSSQDHKSSTPRAPETRMYLLYIQRTSTEYVTEHLRKKGFPVIISAWTVGQLYMVADCPKTTGKTLPLSLYLAVKQYTRIAEEEHEAVERSQSELPNLAWVRIKNSKYRGNIALVFKQLPNGIVAVLIILQDIPYAMPCRSRALVE
ncbi:hypothetical protein BDR07DRAFT_1490590 [Suillus spraguei]|nr:hypothetical protein BDR07DRAFT_1490590 [Suillus spraguei]